jgi:putative transposase
MIFLKPAGKEKRVPHISPSFGEIWGIYQISTQTGCILARMPVGLKRIQDRGDLHFVTFSCYDRRPYLAVSTAKEAFEFSLERMRRNYGFKIVGYVVMPEHVHLLLSEPPDGTLAQSLQALKISTAKRRTEKPFWQRRYYDFNVYTTVKITEKLGYMHRNPVVRGLVDEPEEWKWSSHKFYESGHLRTVQIERVQ